MRERGNRPMWNRIAIACRIVGFALLAAWLIWGVIPAGWRYLERVGWIRHTQITSVYIEGDWLVGEYRSCRALGDLAFVACPKSPKSWDDSEPPRLSASGELARSFMAEEPRTFSVDFYGSLTGNPADTLNCQCRRETDSISCHATKQDAIQRTNKGTKTGNPEIDALPDAK